MNARAKRTRERVLAAQQLHAHSHRHPLTGRIVKGHSGNPSGRKRGKLPRQQHPKHLAKKYTRQLVAVLSSAKVADAFKPLADALPAILQRNADARQHKDAAGDGTQIRGLVELARKKMQQDVHPAAVAEMASDIFGETSSFQRDQLSKQVRAAFGVDVFASDSRLGELTQQFVDVNVSLITGLPERIADDVEKTVMVGLQTGKLYGELADDLQDQYEFGEKRAKTIARDQVGKAFGALNADRCQDLGVDSYIWQTSEDERVRPEHEALDGEEFTFADGAPGEGNPGEPVLCRCTAYPQLSDILGDDDDESDDDDGSDTQDAIDWLRAEVARHRTTADVVQQLLHVQNAKVNTLYEQLLALEHAAPKQGPQGERGRDADTTKLDELVDATTQLLADAKQRVDAAQAMMRTDAGGVLWGQPTDTIGQPGDLLVTPICTTFRWLEGTGWVSTSLAGASGSGGGGEPGPQGPKGDTGATGAKGDTGAAGATGPKGDTGATGAAGTNGTNGTNGADGATGATGAKGDTGAAGATGPKGDTGATGAAGTNGFDGTNGNKWFTGSGPPGTVAGSVANDFYLDTAASEVYQKTSLGVWVAIASIGGATGGTGATGPTGPAGPAPSGTGFVHVTAGVLDTPHELTGDVTAGASGVTAIGAHKVLRGMEAQGAATSVIGVTGNATADVADIAATADGQVLMRLASALGWTDIIQYLLANLGPGGIYGPGTDGSVVFDGSTTILGMVPSGNVYTLTRDIRVVNMTVNTGITVKTAGWRIFGQGKLKGPGTISCSGGNGGNGTAAPAGGAAGTAAIGGSAYFTATIAAGGGSNTGAGGGVALSPATGAFEGMTGTGGSGASGSSGTGVGSAGAGGPGQGGNGGNGGGVTAYTNAGTSLYFPHCVDMVLPVTGSTKIYVGGNSGGGGAGSATGGGGGGGAAGGCVSVTFRWIDNSVGNVIVLLATGGNGGNAAGNGGGGGGAGGGLIIVTTMTPTTLLSTGSWSVAGGTGGAKGGSPGVVGGNGTAGLIYILN